MAASKFQYGGAGASATIVPPPGYICVIDWISSSGANATPSALVVNIDAARAFAKATPAAALVLDSLFVEWVGGYPCWNNSANEDSAPEATVDIAITGFSGGAVINVGYHFEQAGYRRSRGTA